MCWNDGTLQHTTSIPPLVHPSIATSLESRRKSIVSQRTKHRERQCTTGLMLAQVRVFPRVGKYRSLLGDFSSRTNTFVLEIPNRPSGCTPLDTLPESSAGAEHRQERETNETECQTNKSKQANGIRSITLRESKGSGQRHVCPHRENHTTEECQPETDTPQPRTYPVPRWCPQ